MGLQLETVGRGSMAIYTQVLVFLGLLPNISGKYTFYIDRLCIDI
jgi:hypothetical protein